MTRYALPLLAIACLAAILTACRTPEISHEATARQPPSTTYGYTISAEGLPADEEEIRVLENFIRAKSLIRMAIDKRAEGTHAGYRDAADFLVEAKHLLQSVNATSETPDEPFVDRLLATVYCEWADRNVREIGQRMHYSHIDETEELYRKAAELPSMRAVVNKRLEHLRVVRAKVVAHEQSRAEFTDPEYPAGSYAQFDGAPERRFPDSFTEPSVTTGTNGNITVVPLPVVRGGEDAPRQLFAAHIDEVWIVQVDSEREIDDQAPRVYPALKAVVDGAELPLPLEHTRIEAAIAGFIATVDVTQQYRNPLDRKLEAIYVFPLPEDAAVSDFLLTIGDRTIRGIIREREEAERIYAAAKAQGYRAAIMTQERPNIFTQKVANLEPQKRIDVQLTYFSPVTRVGNAWEFSFPTVVGPRFNPPGSTDGIGAVRAGQTGASGQPVEVQYLPPASRSGHDLMLTLDIAAGMPIESIHSPTHVIDIQRPATDRATVRLSPNDTLPNRDLIIRYTLAGDQPRSACLVTRDGDSGGHFALMVEPPAELADSLRQPREMVFVLDCSGSMNGLPIAKSKEAIRRALKRMEPGDAFQIIRFSDSASALGSAPIPATPENIARGLEYVENLRVGGGTMVLAGIKAALQFERDPERLRIVCFMTDGYIGNEAEILRVMTELLGDARIFSFGIGSSVNRYLITEMARQGRGAAAFVTLDEPAMDAVDRFFEQASFPALTNVAIDWRDANVSQIYPGRPGNLFVGRPILLTGRYTGNFPTQLTLTGTARGEQRTFTIPVTPVDHHGIARVWARHLLRDLSVQAFMADADSTRAELQQAMLDTSLAHKVLCAHTAMLAVDSLEATAGGAPETVQVPSHMPHGVNPDTTLAP